MLAPTAAGRLDGRTVVVDPGHNGRYIRAINTRPDLVLSIHGDGSAAGNRGFHVIVSTAMVGGSSAQQSSRRAAEVLVREYGTRTGLPKSNYVGRGTGITPRSDMAGLNLVDDAPALLLEMGNMRNSADWAVLKTRAGQENAARALLETARITLA